MNPGDDPAEALVVDPKAPSPGPPPKSLLEDATKLGVFGALLTYAAGVVVVNVYLINLGVSEFEFLRPRFILTGSLLVGLTVLCAAVPATAWLIVWRGALHASGRFADHTPWTWSTRLAHVVGAIMLLAIPMWVLVYLLRHEPLSAIGMMLGYYAVSCFFGLSVALVVWISRMDESHWVQPQPLPNWLASLFVVPFALGFGGWAIDRFANHVYPKVPEQIGGGKSRAVQLLVAKDEAAALTAVGLPLPSGTRVTGKVELVFRGSDFYVVRPLGGLQTAVLDEKLVVGIRTR